MKKRNEIVLNDARTLEIMENRIYDLKNALYSLLQQVKDLEGFMHTAFNEPESFSMQPENQFSKFNPKYGGFREPRGEI